MVDREAIQRHLSKLSYREREIIKLRFGIDHDQAYTLAEVARICKVTVGRVRSIEAKAKQKVQLLLDRDVG